MSSITPRGATIPGVTHHLTQVGGADLRYVSAGTSGSPILLVHGFPETWFGFHRLIPLLASSHRVVAVDLPGFGDSDAVGPHDLATASVLHELIAHLEMGSVHITGQDISGAAVFRLASTHPEDVRSVTAIETSLPGFGWETFADVAHGGAWYIGLLAEPGMADLLLTGREREFLTAVAFPALMADPSALDPSDLDEFVRTYSRRRGFEGAADVYRSLLREGDELRELAASTPLSAPVLAIGAGGGDFTSRTMSQAVGRPVESAQLAGVGHYPALEAPDALASVILPFLDRVDRGVVTP